MNDNQKSGCLLIAQFYGKSKQEMQAVQELSELIVLLTARPEQRRGEHTAHVAEEIADCRIMLEQLRRLYGVSPAEMNRIIDEKIARTIVRMGANRNVGKN